MSRHVMLKKKRITSMRIKLCHINHRKISILYLDDSESFSSTFTTTTIKHKLFRKWNEVLDTLRVLFQCIQTTTDKLNWFFPHFWKRFNFVIIVMGKRWTQRIKCFSNETYFSFHCFSAVKMDANELAD